MTPKPQLAYKSVLEGVAKGNSSAPLWQWEDEQNDPNDQTKCTIRANPNDHSDFRSRPNANPTVFDGACKGISKSSFLGDDQYPDTIPLKPLSGGFVQIQELPDRSFDNPDGSSYSLNAWGTTDVPNVGARTRAPTFTLRNRSRAFDDQKQRLPLSYKKWSHEEKTSLVRFDYDSSKSAITCTSFALTTTQHNKGSQVVQFENLDKSPINVTACDFNGQPLVSDVKSMDLTNLQLFFVAKVLTSSSDDNPNIVSTGWSKTGSGYSVTINIATSSSGFQGAQTKINLLIPPVSYPPLSAGNRSCTTARKIPHRDLYTPAQTPHPV